MKHEKKNIYHYLDFSTPQQKRSAESKGYKIRMSDTVRCYYVKIPGRLGKNIVAPNQKMVELYVKTCGHNIHINVCRVHAIDVDLTGLDIKQIARDHEEEVRQEFNKRLSQSPSSTRAKQ
jgi:hypothetical protein